MTLAMLDDVYRIIENTLDEDLRWDIIEKALTEQQAIAETVFQPTWIKERKTLFLLMQLEIFQS